MSEESRKFKGVYIQIGDPQNRGSQITARLVFGFIVLTLGALWTLDNLNILESEPILRWWPLALVAFGLSKLTGIIPRRSPVMGTVFTIVGLVLLGNEMEWFSLRIWTLWPLVLIVIGTSLVLRSLRGPSAPASPEGVDRNAEVHTFAMMAGVRQKCESQEFRGGDVSAVMGGAELDLRSARAASPQVVIDVFAWWGGVDIFIPGDWRVVSEVVPVMAGFDDQSRPAEGAAPTTLLIRGAAIMGGIEVKN